MQIPMRSKPSKPSKLTHFDVKTREPLILALIQGVTKAGIVPDKRKERSKRSCRGKIPTDQE